MLEVGRIKARIEGDTADFDKKMASAQQSFQVTARKLDASAQQLAASLKKTYSERVVAANAAASKEIEAAQRSLRERMRLTQNSAEIAAVRQQFNKRVEAVRAGSRAEVQAAQQQYLAASQGLRPVITATEAVATSAAKAAPGVIAMRGAITAMAASALSTAPGVAQLAAVTGTMAIGAPLMIGILAGAAALGLAWVKIGKNAKEAKEEQEKAIEAARKIRMGPLGTEITQKQTVEALRDRLRADLAAAETGRPVMMRGGVTKTIIDQAAILELRKDLKEAEKAVQTFQGVITDANTEGIEDRRKEQERAAEEERQARDKEWKEILAHRKRINDAMRATPMLQFGLDRALNFTQQDVGGRFERLRVGGGDASAAMSRAAQDMEKAAAQALRWFQLGERMLRGAPRTAAPVLSTGGGIGARIGATLKDQFGKEGRERLATGLAVSAVTGGVGAIVGAAASFATGLFTHAKRAREALKLHMEAVNEWDRSMRAAFAALRGETEKSRLFDALDEMTQRIKDSGASLGGVVPVFDTMEDLVEWLKKQQALIAQLNQAFPILGFDALNDRIDQLIQYANELGISLGKTAATANKVSEQLINVPAGFKVALARFNATSTGLTVPDWARSRNPGATGSTNTRAAPVNIQTVNVYGVEDVPDLLEKIETEVARKVARGGSSLTLGWL